MHPSHVKQAEHVSNLQKKPRREPFRVISVTGGKGGVGKTSTSVNLAVSLATSGKRVLLFDADLGLSNVDVLLGLTPKKNISHVFSGEYDLNDIIITGPAGIKIIPAASGIQAMADLSSTEVGGLIQAFSELSDEYDIMLVDTAAGLSNQVMSFVRACQQNIFVVCNEPSSIADAYALIKLLHKTYGHTHFQILANMSRSQREGLEVFYKLKTTTDKFLDITLSYLGSVPYDDQMRHAIQQQKAVVNTYPQSNAAKAFQQLSLKVLETPITAHAQGHMTFFLERLIEFQQSEKSHDRD